MRMSAVNRFSTFSWLNGDCRFADGATTAEFKGELACHSS